MPGTAVYRSGYAVPPAMTVSSQVRGGATASTPSTKPGATTAAKWAAMTVPPVAVIRHAAPSFPPGRPLAAGAIDLMRRIHGDFRYEARSTEVDTPVAQAFAQRRGVCQDLAHVMAGALRQLGLPARYVSGYLNTGDVGHVASHAWVDVYTDRHEWLSLDITHNCITDGRHCRLAIGRDYDSAAPVRGSRMGGGFEALNAYVHVSAQGDDPHAIWMQQQ